MTGSACDFRFHVSPDFAASLSSLSCEYRMGVLNRGLVVILLEFHHIDEVVARSTKCTRTEA